MTIQTSETGNQEPSQVVAQKDTSAETNLRKMARALEEERAQRQRLEQEVAQIRESAQRNKRQEQPEGDDDEPYVDRKRLSKELDRFAQDLENRFDKRVEEKASGMIERERQQAFLKSNTDFNQILGDEAVLQKFVDRHPEIAEPLLEMPDNFARKKLVYQNIKALGLHKPDAPKVSIQEKVDANRRSPYYQPSSAASPPYGANGDFSSVGQKNSYDKMKALINGRRG